MAQRIRFTRKDYEQLPEDWHAELIEGDLVMVPAPDPSHEALVMKLGHLLYVHLGDTASNVDIHIDDQSILQPDVVVLPEGTQRTKRPWTIPTPVWIAEILSPSTRERDRGVKLRLYARKGIRDAWLLDPDDERIEVHDLETGRHTVHDAGTTATSRALPGFTVEVAGFFSR